MSKISLKPNASGTGVFSLEAPNSNVDRTLNLPDEAGTLATVENLPAGYTDSDALDLFNATGSAPVYACRAWVNFDGTGTVSIRDSGNVSSITDVSTGIMRANFSDSMPDNEFSCVANAGNLSDSSTFTGVSFAGGTIFNTNYIQFDIFRSQVLSDVPMVAMAVFR